MPHAMPASNRRLARLLTVALLSGTAALAAPLAAPLAAQQDAAARRMRLERELDAATATAVVRLIDDATARGLPAEPLYNKAFEGRTRGLPPATIRRAVESLAARLEVARRALAPASPIELGAGADALAQGVPETTLRQLREARPKAPLHVELGVLTQLVAGRVPVARASAQILDLVRRGTRPAQIHALGRDVAQDVALGLEPADALDVRAVGVLVGSGTVAATADAAPAELTNSGSPGGRGSTAPKVPRPRRP